MKDLIERFESSNVAENAKEKLRNIDSNPALICSSLDYANIRDYLLTSIALVNANRPEVAANMLLEEFSKALYETKLNKWLMNVKNHKTFKKDGPNVVYFSLQLYNYMRIYVNNVRPKFVADCGNIFITSKGKAFEAAGISRQINAMWKKTEISGDDNLTMLLRKLFALNMYQINNVQSVANAMDHHLPLR